MTVLMCMNTLYIMSACMILCSDKLPDALVLSVHNVSSLAVNFLIQQLLPLSPLSKLVVIGVAKEQTSL